MEKAGAQDSFLSEEPVSLLESGRVTRVPLLIGVNRDETAYFYPMIVDARPSLDRPLHEKELIPNFLEAATPYKGPLKETVMPSILYTYFNGVDLANLTSIGTRFINVRRRVPPLPL